MEYYGDLDIIGGSQILKLKVEKLDTTPSFDPDQEARMIYVLDEKAIKINDGSEWITVQYSNSSSEPLIETLGTEWINEDSSLNPDSFNTFSSVKNVTSNDSLFVVLQKMDQAIGKNTTSNFSSLPDVHLANLQVGDVIYRTSTGYSNTSLTSLALARLEFRTSNLKDVKATAPFKSGQIYQWSITDNAFINKTVFYEYLNTAANTSFVVPHNLGKQHCFVQIIDLNTNLAITDNYSISYNNVNQLTVTITPATGVKILVWAFNPT